MNEQDLIRTFPARRISPFDGMAVTSQIWEEAHAFHRQRQQLQDLFCHGPGILTGLQVVASDPPGSAVYIEPGIALDPLGQIIVLPEHVRYDIAQAYGRLYLLLSYGESRPRAGEQEEDGPLYVHAEFGIEARPSVPEGPCVELARVRRQDRTAPIANPGDRSRPGLNEIDARFRRQIAAPPTASAGIAVTCLGRGDGTPHARGVGHLARTLRQFGPCRAWVDENVPCGDDLGAYDLVYLVGRGAFQPAEGEMTALYTYLQGGGTVLIESCHRDQAGGDPAADAAFSGLLGSLGVQMAALPAGHRLLAEPYLFSAPPAGFETEGPPTMSLGGLAGDQGVIWSTADYGCLWQGERRGRGGSREEIRAALEWGCNIVAYALDRRQARQSRQTSRGGRER